MRDDLQQLDINLLQDATNVVELDQFLDILEATCAKIYDTLAAHCGPYATNAMLIQGIDETIKVDAFRSVFSKDGIDIVNSIRFVSPVQTHIKNLIAYVGSRVDAASKDGTTTAMMLFTDVLRRYASYCRGMKPKNRVATIKLVLDVLRKTVTENTITVESLCKDFEVSEQDAKRFIAWNQAMISSKGDREIADAVTEVVLSLTPEMYSQFTIDQSRMETDKRITVDIDQFQYKLDAGIVSHDYLNHRLKTEYLQESCDVIVESNQLIRGNPVCELLMEKLSPDAPPLERTLVIICEGSDSYLTQFLHGYNVVHENKVIVFNRLNGGLVGGTSATLDAIRAMAGVYSASDFLSAMGEKDLPYIIRDVKVHFKQGTLRLDRLYDAKGAAYHPYYSDPDAFPPYTVLLRTLKEQLEEYEQGHKKHSGSEDSRIMHLVRIYQRMMCTKVARLEISGTTHDSLADYSVVKDAFGAVLSCLNDGFVLDGLGTMLTGLDHRYRTSVLCESKCVQECFVPMIASLASLIRVVHDEPEQRQSRRQWWWHTKATADQTSVPRLESWPRSYKYKYRPAGAHTTLVLTRPEVVSMGADTTVLIQPAKGYLELFRRLEELLPKILCTTRVIIPDKFNLSEAEV